MSVHHPQQQPDLDDEDTPTEEAPSELLLAVADFIDQYEDDGDEPADESA